MWSNRKAQYDDPSVGGSAFFLQGYIFLRHFLELQRCFDWLSSKEKCEIPIKFISTGEVSDAFTYQG